MAKSVMAMLPAELEDVAEPLRDEDELLTADELKTLPLFEQLEKTPSFERFPGFIVLRHCSEGRVMCSQGDAGATAFLILTTQDVLMLRERQLQTIRETLQEKADQRSSEQLQQRTGHLTEPELRDREQELLDEIERLRERLLQLQSEEHPEDMALRQVATANLLVDMDGNRPRRGLLHRLLRALSRREADGDTSRPDSIPFDGPADIDTQTLRAPLHEGELFGEMSCMNRAPRSATVIVTHECYMLEMIRNVLDMLHNDSNYKQRMDQTYRQRVLKNHVRRLSIFEDLTDEEFALLEDSIELVDFDSGSVVFEEHEPSDCFYVIRSGLVKVVSNAACRVREAEFTDSHWKSLGSDFAAGADNGDQPMQLVCRSLPAEVQQTLRDSAGESTLTAEHKQALLQALNDFILQPNVSKELGRKTDEIVEAVGSNQLKTAVADFPEAAANWSDLERRTFFRLLLEHVCPTGMPKRAASSGPRRTLTYLGRGDFFGEIGVILDQPRSATCYAYDHPDGGYHQRIPDSRTGAVPSRVELVRIGKKEFHQLLQSSEKLQRRVDQVIAKRQQRSEVKSKISVAEISGAGMQSPEFEQMGLIQGQQLMLIDLDRCTRCGACVDACVRSHDDGRTRLYLDGPRFDKYLVPLTCRKCLDPVCMIGCPVGAINRGDNGEIRIRDWCIGCRMCAEQCPYGSIQMNELKNPVELSAEEKALLGPDTEIKKVDERAVVCDLCSSLTSQDPSCVYACPHDAALRVDAREFFFEPVPQTSVTLS